MFKNKFCSILIAVCSLLVSFGATAHTVHVTVKLGKISVLQTAEKNGDKVYFSISSYPTKAVPVLTRIPEFPLHWLSKDFKNMSNITLWQGDILPNQGVMLILSLIEQASLPFAADDHIGSAQLTLYNNNGKLQEAWGQPHFIDQPKVQQPDLKIPKFIMYGNKSKYVTIFKIVTQ